MLNHLLLDRAEFLETHMQRYAKVFAVPPTPRKPFADEGWHGLLFEGSFLAHADAYEAIRAASTMVGDDGFLLTAMYGAKGFATSIQAQWPGTFDEFLGLRAAGQLDFTPASELFGATSDKWGCCFFFDEYFHVGGIKAFVDCIAERLGGYDVLRDEFFEFAAHDWPMGAGDRNAILKSVGWERKIGP